MKTTLKHYRHAAPGSLLLALLVGLALAACGGGGGGDGGGSTATPASAASSTATSSSTASVAASSLSSSAASSSATTSSAASTSSASSASTSSSAATSSSSAATSSSAGSTSSASSTSSSGNSSSAGATSQTLDYLVQDSVTVGTATQTITGSSAVLTMDGKTFTYTVGATLSNPSSPSGYFWTGTQANGGALPLATVPLARLCQTGASNTTAGYVVIAPNATALTLTSANTLTLKGKKLYRRDCGDTSASTSKYMLFNNDGSVTLVEGGSLTMTGSEIDKFFSPSGYTYDLGDGRTEYGLVRAYQVSVNGVTRYFVTNTGYTTVTATGARAGHYWVDYWVEEAFYGQ